MKGQCRPVESVDLGHVNIIQLLDSEFDLWFVRLLVNDEDKRVVVLDLLHCRLSRQGEADHLVLVQPKQ